MLLYDWKDTYRTVKAAESDLNRFKYKCDGWYHEKSDTLLVIREKNGRCTVYCWNGPANSKFAPLDRKQVIDAMLDQIKLVNLPDRKLKKVDIE